MPSSQQQHVHSLLQCLQKTRKEQLDQLYRVASKQRWLYPVVHLLGEHATGKHFLLQNLVFPRNDDCSLWDLYFSNRYHFADSKQEQDEDEDSDDDSDGDVEMADADASVSTSPATIRSIAAIKILKSAEQYREAALDEIKLLKTLKSKDVERSVPIVHMLDDFVVRGPNGNHMCVVFELAGEDLLKLIRKYDHRGVPLRIVKTIMRDVLAGLDFMHTKCNIIHTDIKPENVLMSVPSRKVQEAIAQYKIPADSSVPLEARDASQLTKQQLKRLRQKQKLKQEEGSAEAQESADAVAEKEEGEGREESSAAPAAAAEAEAAAPTLSEEEMEKYKPKFDNDEDHLGFKIVDFGNACFANKQFATEVQTRQYRSPEVIVEQGYDASADVWSAACLAFELATGDYLFDPKSGQGYSRDDDHLAQMIELLGDAPAEIVKQGKQSYKYFMSNGQLKRIKHLKFWSLKDVLHDKYKFSSAEAEAFSSFLLPMLKYNKKQRATAAQCLSHPWLHSVSEEPQRGRARKDNAKDAPAAAEEREQPALAEAEAESSDQAQPSSSEDDTVVLSGKTNEPKEA